MSKTLPIAGPSRASGTITPTLVEISSPSPSAYHSEVGFGSVLDAYQTGPRPGPGVAGPFSAEVVAQVFGTAKPQAGDFERGKDALGERLTRGEAAWLVLYAGERPDELCFLGYAVDTHAFAADDDDGPDVEDFMKPVTPSAELAAIVGAQPLLRTEVTARLWKYIADRGLQDRVDLRNINADESLKRVVDGRSTVTMFEMTKLLNRHLR